MTFEQAMTFVEVEHQFPDDPSDFHNRRAAEIFERSGLRDELKGIPTVVVAGSCGKASTARYLAECAAALFELTGTPKTVGLGTKPPLHETLDGNRERYQLLANGKAEWISQTAFAELVGKLPSDLPARTAPYDLRAWLLGRFFVDQGVGLGIVEANIGLRNDPAILYPDPAAVMLTPIGVDHVALLRPDGAPPEVLALGDRAGPLWHKYYSLPSGGRLVCGLQDPDVAELVAGYDGTLRLGGRDFTCQVLEQSLSGSRARLEINGLEPIEVQLQTVGRHQVENACQAAATLYLLWETGVLPGGKDHLRQAIVTGLARTSHPGRMQRVAENPTILLNAATGQIKLKAMMETLEEAVGRGERVAVLMSVLQRLLPSDGTIPNWLDVSLRRILESPVVESFTATGLPEDAPPEPLASWAAERAPDGVPIRALAADVALREARRRAPVVILVGQGLAELKLGPASSTASFE